MRSIRKIPLAAAIISAGLALVAAQGAGCVTTDACPDAGPPTVGAVCIGDEICRYEDTKCGGEFQCLGGAWILNSAPKPGCANQSTGSMGAGGREGSGGSGLGGSEPTGPGGGANTGGSNAGGGNAGGGNAGGANAGGSSAGGSNAGGNASGGSSAGGNGMGGAAASSASASASASTGAH